MDIGVLVIGASESVSTVYYVYYGAALVSTMMGVVVFSLACECVVSIPPAGVHVSNSQTR